MYKSKKFIGMTEFDRKGILNKVIIPAELDGLIKHDFDVNKVTKAIEFKGGNKENGSPYLICTEFGVHDEVYINCFFINGGIVVELETGTLYVREEGRKTLAIHDTGVVTESHVDDRDIRWVDYYDYLKHNISILVAHKYNPPAKQIENYVNNLAFTMTLENLGKHGDSSFKSRVINYFVDLGVDEFEFIAYERNTFDSGNTYVSNKFKKEKIKDEELDEEFDDDDDAEDTLENVEKTEE